MKWSPSTYATNEGSIRNYIIQSIGNLKMKQLATKKMDEFFNSLHGMQKVPIQGRPGKGVVSNRMIKEMHVLLTTVFNKGVEWGDLPRNPITKSSRPEVEKKEVAFLEPKQTKYFIS